jgi:uncharacterized protein
VRLAAPRAAPAARVRQGNALANAFPSSYRQLAPYAARFAAGEVVYPQGATPDRIYVVLSGRLDFRVVDANGAVSVVAEALPGQIAGHVAAITGRPTSAAAHAAEDTVLIGVPVNDLADAFKIAPELAVELIHLFAESDRRQGHRATPRAAVDVAAEGSTEPVPEGPQAVGEGAGSVSLDAGWDETFFFVDSATCPVSATTFEFLRVRTSAVRPSSRDSDFRVVYASHDPTRYSIVVCPKCGYAAYLDDFATVDEEEREALVANQAERDRLGPRKFRGPRDLREAAQAIDLALASYDRRKPNERRKAVLLHRRAWVERERNEAESERNFLRQAREAYKRAFERDSSISDETAMRAAYIIGDLSLRLDDIGEGVRWLETATKFPDAKKQTGLTRLAWERMQTARELSKRRERWSA